MWIDDFIGCLEASTAEVPCFHQALAIKQENLPDKIYKYRCNSEYALSNLKTDTVWMASPESYNDPYDSWLTFPCDSLQIFLESQLVDKFVVATKLGQLITRREIEKAKASSEPLNAILKRVQLLRSSGASQFWGDRATSYSTKLLQYARDGVEMIEKLRKLEKVCSFSAEKDSLLMWSHYADHHKGFCIEYDIESLGSQHFFRRNLYPVVYSEEIYDLRPFVESLASGPRKEFKPLIPLVAMLHKFEGWEYEREWRLMDETEVVEPDRPRAAPVPTRIFLGTRFDRLIGKELLSVSHGKGIPISQMHLGESEFILMPQSIRG
jgi:hypothetical protein